MPSISSDTTPDTQIRLFLIAAALALGSAGLTVGGYNNPIVAKLLFATAGVVMFTGIAWPWLKTASALRFHAASVIAAALGRSATDVITWFGLVAGTVLFLGVLQYRLSTTEM